MTGEEHYAEAERLLLEAEQASRGADQAAAALLIAQAQVHALLALTTATAIRNVRETVTPVPDISVTDEFFPDLKNLGTGQKDDKQPYPPGLQPPSSRTDADES